MLKGVKCDDANHYGEEFSFEECLACARQGGPRRCHNPLPLLVAMSQSQKERQNAGISATMLLDCPRKVILMQEHDYYEHPASYWHRFRGTIGHLMMEAYGSDEQDVIQEIRVSKTIDVVGVDVQITGKADWIDIKRKLLIDFKSAKSINTKPINQGQPKEEHVKQLSIYRWLWHGGTAMEDDRHGYVKAGEVVDVQIERAGLIYFDMKATQKVVASLWSLEETEAYVVERLTPLVQYRLTQELPDFLMDEQGRRHFFCNYCAIRDICDSRG